MSFPGGRSRSSGRVRGNEENARSPSGESSLALSPAIPGREATQPAGRRFYPGFVTQDGKKPALVTFTSSPSPPPPAQATSSPAQRVLFSRHPNRPRQAHTPHTDNSSTSTDIPFCIFFKHVCVCVGRAPASGPSRGARQLSCEDGYRPKTNNQQQEAGAVVGAGEGGGLPSIANHSKFMP